MCAPTKGWGAGWDQTGQYAPPRAPDPPDAERGSRTRRAEETVSGVIDEGGATAVGARYPQEVELGASSDLGVHLVRGVPDAPALMGGFLPGARHLHSSETAAGFDSGRIDRGDSIWTR
jgi:hypothetical protein